MSFHTPLAPPPQPHNTLYIQITTISITPISLIYKLTRAARNTFRTESFAAMVTTCMQTSWISLASLAFPPDPAAPPSMGGTLDWWGCMWGRRRGMDSREMCTTAVSRAFQSVENRPSTAIPNIYKKLQQEKEVSICRVLYSPFKLIRFSAMFTHTCSAWSRLRHS